MSRRQYEILGCIAEYVRRHGWAPSHEDICELAFIASKSTVNGHLQALEREGLIARASDASARALRITSSGYAALNSRMAA